ncbi:SRPBCC family protein [Nesterenkonia sphaerica]|uniref:Polyketide cyclase n=1 Tax=Nesterenkonia sphaerica TaxID=1804988 RepID=A0A5R9AAT3_9MICC|nr:SRPBCC family protein [Nesterenkonia sphaerica]TLP75738.1 polyketide cyclase [Nesterenkonia sphaerica]
MTQEYVVQASDTIDAPAARIFELLADPAKQAQWDGNNNVGEAESGQQVSAVGDVFTVRLTNDKVRDNHVVEFAQDRLIAWKPANEGQAPAGHLWRWQLEERGDGTTVVTHTYDWSELTDQARLPKARSIDASYLAASIERLKEVVTGR